MIKKSKSHWNLLTLGGLLFTSAIIITVTVVLIVKSRDQSLINQRRAVARQVYEQYFTLHQAGNWWLTVPPQQPTTELIDIAEWRQEHISNIVKRYADVSPATKAIAQAFSRFRVTYSTGGSSMQVMRNNPKVNDQPVGFEICFYARQELNQHPANLYYRREWKAMMVAAIVWPEKVFPALLFHELGHALADKEGRPSAGADDDSDSWIGEEVEMHTIEENVLNATSGARYHNEIDRILNRSNARSPEEASLSFTISDLKELDRILGCEKGGSEVASSMLAEYRLSLGFRYIDSALPERERQEAKIAFYRLVRQPL